MYRIVFMALTRTAACLPPALLCLDGELEQNQFSELAPLPLFEIPLLASRVTGRRQPLVRGRPGWLPALPI